MPPIILTKMILSRKSHAGHPILLVGCNKAVLTGERFVEESQMPRLVERPGINTGKYHAITIDTNRYAHDHPQVNTPAYLYWSFGDFFGAGQALLGGALLPYLQVRFFSYATPDHDATDGSVSLTTHHTAYAYLLTMGARYPKIEQKQQKFAIHLEVDELDEIRSGEDNNKSGFAALQINMAHTNESSLNDKDISTIQQNNPIALGALMTTQDKSYAKSTGIVTLSHDNLVLMARPYASGSGYTGTRYPYTLDAKWHAVFLRLQ